MIKNSTTHGRLYIFFLITPYSKTRRVRFTMHNYLYKTITAATVRLTMILKHHITDKNKLHKSVV